MTYADALALLGSKDQRKVGHETWMVRGGPDPNLSYKSMDVVVVGYGRASVVVYYHQTPVVRIFEDGTYQLYNGSWYTRTTRKRFEQFSPVQVSGRMRPHGDGPWTITQSDGTERPYSHYMTVA